MGEQTMLQPTGAESGGETAEALLTDPQARVRGRPVSPTQLARWHREGYLPTPKHKGLGRGRGTVSIYPAGTREQLRALCAFLSRERDAEKVAWRMWWAGYDVAEKYVRDSLEREAADWGRAMQQLRELLGRTSTTESEAADSGELPEAFFDFLDQMSSRRIPKVAFAQARKRIGRERFATFMRLLIEVSTGTFTGYTVDAVTGTADEERQLTEAALGVTRGRTDRLADAGPWLTGDTEDALRDINRLVQQHPPGFGIETATLEELARTRDEVKAFVAMLVGWSAVFEQMFGRGAFGLTAFQPIFQDQRPQDQAMWVLLWRTLRMADVGAAMDLLLPVAQQWQQSIQPVIAATQQLREEVPATAALLDPKQIGRGLRNKHEEARRLAALRQVREENAEELDAYFAKHPEVTSALTEETLNAESTTEVLPTDDHSQDADPRQSRPQRESPRERGDER
jgi:hypothetical protein